MKRNLSLLTLLALGLAACDGGTDAKPVVSLRVTPQQPTVTVGGTVQLQATAIREDGTSQQGVRADWSSLDPQFATVDGSGTVRGVAEGSARIVAEYQQKADTVSVLVGDFMVFNVSGTSACSVGDNRPAHIKATGQHVIVMEEVGVPSGGFTDAEYQSIAQAFDQQIWPVDTGNFGEPGDIDANGKVIILYTKAVNELTDPGSNSVVAGFFFSRDLFPRAGSPTFDPCATSNEAELFYMLVPDPNGEVNGNKRTKDFVFGSTLGTVAHEFQHLINASRRMQKSPFPDFEEDWLDEGLSHIAEELMFYATTDLSVRSDLDADRVFAMSRRTELLAYGVDNLLRLGIHYEDPSRTNVFEDRPPLDTRGAAWSYLRYVADRHPGGDQPLWFSLVNANAVGLANVSQAIGASPLTWMRDWGVAAYTDNAVPNVGTDYRLQSWNFRSILPGFQKYDQFPLKTRSLGDGSETLTLAPGASAYLRFGVAPATQAEIRTTSGGGTVAGSCGSGATTLNLAVGEVFHGTPANASVLCIAGGATGSEYVYVPFYATGAQTANLNLEVNATGVIPAVGPPNPSLAPAFDADVTVSKPQPQLRIDWEWHNRLRERARRELTPLIRNRADGGRYDEVLADQAPPELRISIVRTK